jgi:hypothetical protein
MRAADMAVTVSTAQLARLQKSGGSASEIQEAKTAQAGAIAAKDRLKNLSSGEPFDEEERHELRMLHKGVEAAEGLSLGLRSLRRLAVARANTPAARAVAESAAATDKLLTKQDKQRAARNLERAEEMEREARAQLAQLEVRAKSAEPPYPTAQEWRTARMNVMAAANQPIQLRRMMSSPPRDAAEAARLRQHQIELEEGTGLPENLRELHRLSAARRGNG